MMDWTVKMSRLWGECRYRPIFDQKKSNIRPKNDISLSLCLFPSFSLSLSLSLSLSPSLSPFSLSLSLLKFLTHTHTHNVNSIRARAKVNKKSVLRRFTMPATIHYCICRRLNAIPCPRCDCDILHLTCTVYQTHHYR
jgi:hypothetical protein